MSEGVLVNIGAPSWPDDVTAQMRVRKMQTKLHCWAVEQPGRQFDDLFNLVYDPAFLVVAWLRFSGNAGAQTPGVDGACVAQILSQVGANEYLCEVRGLLQARTFRPVEVRQVEIPKSRGKQRKLGIPTVTDRVVQASLKLVLEPIFEADFHPCSYGLETEQACARRYR